MLVSKDAVAEDEGQVIVAQHAELLLKCSTSSPQALHRIEVLGDTVPKRPNIVGGGRLRFDNATDPP